MFTVSWPSNWASSGYHSFTFGLKTKEEAREWHRRVQESIESIDGKAERRKTAKRKVSAGRESVWVGG
jgi:hypothetical protein